MNGLDIYEYHGEGFKPLVDFESWRVALTCYGEKQSLQAINSISRHLETDEVFVLLNGSCTLFVGGCGDIPDFIEFIDMEPLKIYNIIKGTWHARALTPDTTILIVENCNTSAHNSESLELSEVQKMMIRMSKQ